VGGHHQSDAEPPGHTPHHRPAHRSEKLPAIDAGQAAPGRLPHRSEDAEHVAPTPQPDPHYGPRFRSDDFRQMEQQGRLPCSVWTFDRARSTDGSEPLNDHREIEDSPTTVARYETGRRNVTGRERIPTMLGVVEKHDAALSH
jgi:hypothetical protein